MYAFVFLDIISCGLVYCITLCLQEFYLYSCKNVTITGPYPGGVRMNRPQKVKVHYFEIKGPLFFGPHF